MPGYALKVNTPKAPASVEAHDDLYAEPYASDKQCDYIITLAGERDWDPSTVNGELIRSVIDGWNVNRKCASIAIDYLMLQSRKSDPNAEDFKPGDYFIHTSEGIRQVYTVVASKMNPNKTYVKRLVVRQGFAARWVYAPGAKDFLTDADKATLEEMKSLGRAYGVCMKCGRLLTDDTNVGPDGLTSIKRGIGPICAKRFM